MNYLRKSILVDED